MRHFFRTRSARSLSSRRRLLVVKAFEDRILLAGNLLLSAEIAGSTGYKLLQYTTQGSLVSSQSIPMPPGSSDAYEDARGLSVDPTGNLNIYDGTFNPYLATLKTSTNAWSFLPCSGWSTINNVSYGAVATYKNDVFASDMLTAGDTKNGIVKFDMTNGSTARLGQGTDYIQLTLGLDGLLYGLSGPNVDVFNPDTGVQLRTITLTNGPDTDIRSIAVEASGQVLAASWGGYLMQFDTSGNYVQSIHLKNSAGNTESLVDIALDTDGQVALGGRLGEVWVTNEALATPTMFATGMWNVFVTFDHYIGTSSQITTSLVGGQLQIQSSNGSVNTAVRLTPGDSTTLQVLDNGSVVSSFATSTVTSIAVNFLGGNSALTIDQTNGDPVPTGGLSYEGSSGNTLTVNGAGTAADQTITIDTMIPAGDTAFDTIAGMAAGVIRYEDADTSSVTLYTGTGNNTVNVHATATTTNVVGSGALTVNVGNAGSVQNIQGVLNIEDPGHAASVLVDDSTDLSRSVILSSFTPAGDSDAWGALGGLAPAAIQYEGPDTSLLTINGGSHGNTFSVQGIPTGAAVVLNTGGGNDTVQVGSTANTLDAVQGALTVNGQAGTDSLIFQDQGQTAGQSYTVSPTSVTRVGIATATFGTIEKLSLTAGSGADAMKLAGVLTATTTLAGGAGTNTFAGPDTNSTWTINAANGGKLGKVTFSSFQILIGGSGKDTFKFSGSGSLAGTIDGGGTGNKLDYSTLAGPVTINLQTLSAPLVDGGSAGGFSNIQSFGGSNATTDTLIGPDTNLNWIISGTGAGKAGTTAFSHFENLVGGNGVDVFKFSGSGTLAGSIDGGGAPSQQGNWLDYSGQKSAITVNLATGTATRVAGRVSNIQNVHGGNAGNTLTGDAQGTILIGGTGNDTLTGGSGVSLLIGDKGLDQITGGSGGDILIGNLTTYDTMTVAHEDALMAILAEWQSADSYATRFHDINTGTGGGLNGMAKLNFGSTVKDDAAADTLTAAVSAQPLDWFFQGAGDNLVNQEAGEHINNG